MEIEIDQQWLDNQQKFITDTEATLEGELKRYQTNLIKESIRLSLVSLADFHYSCAALPMALKYYNLMRDYLTLPSHILEMCENVIKVCWEMGDYSGVVGAWKRIQGVPAMPEKDELVARMEVVIATGEMVGGRFLVAARGFAQVKFATLNEPMSSTLSGRDVAVYGTLCALAAMSRKEVKFLIESADFKGFLELESRMRELLKLFYLNKYKICFEKLESLRSELSVDLYLGDGVYDKLVNEIRKKAALLYCKPLVNVDMKNMSRVFGLNAEETEKIMCTLISEGLDARIDMHNQVVRMRSKVKRLEMYKDTLAAGESARDEILVTAMRAKLLLCGMTVKTKAQ